MLISVERGALVRSFGTGPIIVCLHGFADNSSMFAPLESTSVTGRFNFVCPDMPGCGVSPANEDVDSVDGYASWVRDLAREVAIFGPVGLVAHSAAGPVAVRAVQMEPDMFCGVFSIEGNLTADDAFFSGKAANFADGPTFKTALKKEVLAHAEHDERALRYYGAVDSCDAATLWRFGKSITAASSGLFAAQAFAELPVPTHYFWSRSSSSQATRAVIEGGRFAQTVYGGGHMPTLELPEATAAAIAKFFDRAFEAYRDSAA